MSLPVAPFISQKFRYWSFISMLCLVYVHGYNLNERYLQPWSIVDEPLSFNSFMQYFVANGLLRFRIPMLFAISGYLYALHDDQPWKVRTGKRLRTLLLPYLLWSAIGLAITYLLEMFTGSREWVMSAHLAQIDEKRMLLHEYRWPEWLFRWLIAPVSFQLWFIRVLLVYNIAFPLLKRVINHQVGKWIFFIPAFLFWIATGGLIFIEGEGLLFFSLGIWIQQSGFDIEHYKRWLRPGLWVVVFIISITVKTWLAFKGYALLKNNVFILLTLLHKLAVFSGLITAWYGCDGLVKACMQRKWFVWLSAFSFIIYALHVPLLTYLINPSLELLHGIPHARLLVFIALPLCIAAFCVLSGVLMRRFIPRIYSLLTGGRGL